MTIAEITLGGRGTQSFLGSHQETEHHPKSRTSRNLFVALGWLSPEHKAVMESFSVNEKPPISVRDGVGNERNALGKAKAESIHVCFFDCSSVGHIQVLLKIVDKHFLFSYPSYRSDVGESFTGNLEEKKIKMGKSS